MVCRNIAEMSSCLFALDGIAQLVYDCKYSPGSFQRTSEYACGEYHYDGPLHAVKSASYDQSVYDLNPVGSAYPLAMALMTSINKRPGIPMPVPLLQGSLRRK